MSMTMIEIAPVGVLKKFRVLCLALRDLVAKEREAINAGKWVKLDALLRYKARLSERIKRTSSRLPVSFPEGSETDKEVSEIRDILRDATEREQKNMELVCEKMADIRRQIEVMNGAINIATIYEKPSAAAVELVNQAG